MKGGVADASSNGLEGKITASAGTPVEVPSLIVSIEVLSEEKLRSSGIMASRSIFNNYTEDLKRVADIIFKGTHEQVDITKLPEYEKVILAIADLKRAGMREISTKYAPKTNVHYHPMNGQINGHNH